MMDRNSKKAWLYLLPSLVLLGAFLVYPLIDVLVYSGEECYNFASQTYQGIGLYNYDYVLHDPYFLQAVENTFVLVVFTVPISTILALVISTALSSIKPLRQLYQTIYFLPYVHQHPGGGAGVHGAVPAHGVHRRPGEPGTGAVRRLPHRLLSTAPTGPRCSCCAFTPSGWCCPLRSWCSPAPWPLCPRSTTWPPGWTAPPAPGFFFRITLPMISPMIVYLVITGFIGAFKAYSDAVALFGVDLNAAGMNTITLR